MTFCLRVPAEHRDFERVASGEKLKIDLILNSSLVHLYYSPDSDPTPRLLLDRGAFTSASGASSVRLCLTSRGLL